MHIGSTISHYRIVEKLGEGGMGVVYKADDTKLNRAVALKFLAEHLLGDNEAKERFLREAQAAAALHHPNICPVHEIDEVDGKTFISMAFLKGETLEDLIAKGPLPIKDALDIARQVADGLQAAHAEGIVHRDIKPANIIVSPEGRPTIMDFGLARLTEASRLTKVDTAMGTVAYMSPEQAQGMEVDSRSDIWALGCVLYEMVSGQRPFRGVYDQALLYEIVHEEPAALTGLRSGVPLELELLAGKCLAKDREDRPESAREVARELRTLSDKLKSGRSTILRAPQLTGSIPATMTGARTLNPAATLPPDAVVVGKRRLQAVYGLAALLGMALLGVSFAYFTQAQPEAPAALVGRFSFAPEGVFQDPTGLGGPRPSISPDGKYILYLDETGDENSLWVRPLASEFPRRLERTEGAIWAFWSPDSQSIGFATAKELKRMSLEGGIPITLCELCELPSTFFSGGAWSPDGKTIVFSSGSPPRLYRIPARGGDRALLIPDMRGLAPIFLPSVTPALVFATGGADSRLNVLNLTTGEVKELREGSNPGYSGGYLVYGAGEDRQAGIWAMPFSLDTLDATGESFPIDTGGRRPTVSRDGILAYENYTTQAAGLFTLVWRNRSGKVLGTIGQPQSDMRFAALSPDGTRVAVMSTESGSEDIWVHDVTRSTKTRLTFAPGDERSPVWASSGQEIVYRRDGAGIERMAADGTGNPTVLTQTGSFSDLSRDGRYLVFHDAGATLAQDIFYVELSPDGGVGEPKAFLSEPGTHQVVPKLSPDGRFLAYVSNESGRFEIYVRPFPDGAGKWQASVEGGTRPRWRSDGKELFFVAGSTLMAVSVSTDSGFTLGQPQRLFDSPDLSRGELSAPYHDVSADGQRFVTIASLDEIQPGASEPSKPEPPKIRVVQNWYEEFRNREQ